MWAIFVLNGMIPLLFVSPFVSCLIEVHTANPPSVGTQMMSIWLVGINECLSVCCTVLYCTVLYCTVLYCTVLYCTVLYCTVLQCTVLYCTVLYRKKSNDMKYIVWTSMYWCDIMFKEIR